MKVIHLISGGDVGGAKTHVHTLLGELSRHIPALLVCFKQGDFAREAEQLGIRTLVVEAGFRSTLSRLEKVIRSEGYDIVHCHGSKANMFGAILKRRLGLPVITTVHSDYKLDYLGRIAKRLTFGTINAVALRLLDDYVCVSGHMRDLLIGRGFAPESTFLISNGLDYAQNQVNISREEFLAAQGIPADAITVGIAARLSPVKNIGILIDAFAETAKTESRLWLLIAGDGEEAQSLKAKAASTACADRIVFAGWLSDTNSFYHAIDINALTSLSEGFPYSIVEGARMQCATVSSDVGGISTLVKNGVTGYLFPSGDTAALTRILQKLAGDGELRRQLGQAIYQAARETFSIEYMGKTQLEIYKTVLRRSRRQKKKRDGVTLCGAYGQGNRGDDSIMQSVIAMLRTIDPDIPLRILSKNPAETRIQARCKSVGRFDLWGMGRAMKSSKLFISGGGTLIQDVTSLRSLLYYLAGIRLAHALGCKVLMFGCGVGPVCTAPGRKLTGRVLNRCVDLITVREPRSQEELKKLGVTVPEIRVSADPALILNKAADADVDSAMITAGIPKEGSYVAVSLRPWKGFDEKAGAFAASLSYLYRMYGLVPVFIAIDGNRDTQTAEKVRALLGGIPSYDLTDCPPQVIMGFLSRCRLLISMRLHALIFGAGQGVPLIGATYDPKVSAFLDYIGSPLHRELEEITEEFLTDSAIKCLNGIVEPPSVDKLLKLEKINIDAAKELLNA